MKKTAVSEMVLRLLKLSLPSESVIQERRKEYKERHWVQSVRRNNQASIGDYATKKEHRAPIIPAELKVCAWSLIFCLHAFPFVMNFLAVLSIYIPIHFTQEHLSMLYIVVYIYLKKMFKGG